MQKKMCTQHNENTLLMEYIKNVMPMYMYMTYLNTGVTLK